VNDAPVQTVPGVLNLNEDTPTAITGISISDVDAAGNVTVTLTGVGGTLVAATNVGGGVTSGQISGNGSGTVTITAPLANINTLLANAAGITFTPTLNTSGAGSVTVSTNDGSATDTDTIVTNVAGVNDAPVNTVPGSRVALQEILSNISGLSIADIDAGTANVRVTLTATNGVLNVSSTVGSGLTAGQITNNGSATVTITAPLTTINTTLANVSGLRYLGDLGFNGTAFLTVTTNDLGNSPAPSLTDTDTVTIDVQASNAAPVLNNSGAPTLTAIHETEQNNSGTLVSDLIASAGFNMITDVDAGAVEGLAITAVDDSMGQWQYSLNGSAGPWSAIGPVSNSSARLLAADANTKIRFIANMATLPGMANVGISFRAWDRFTGINGALANTNVNGGATAFSTGTEDATILVNSAWNVSGTTVTVTGLATDDTLSIAQSGGNVTTTLTNALYAGISKTHALAGVTTLVFNAGGGSNDRTVFNGAAVAETVATQPNAMQVTRSGLSFSGTSSEFNYFIGDASDYATFVDSPANDIFSAQVGSTVMYNSPTTYVNQVTGLSNVTADATGGGTDSAILFDTTGDDTFYARPGFAQMYRAGTFNLQANGFEKQYGRSTSGGTDTQLIYDSTANDTAYLRTDYSYITSANYYSHGLGFDKTYLFGNAGGAADTNDRAFIYDSVGNDKLYMLAAYSIFVGGGVTNQASAFNSVTASGSSGFMDTDTAFMYDSAGNDALTSRPTSVELSGAGFKNIANVYDIIHAYGNNG
ncbi:MAG: hypothetical protein JNM18_27460, partial [Planctomycetaceae bacterium]|nr:hypothetical protein [Planctomycetaceae bacterium]